MKYFIIILVFLALFLYVTLKSFQVSTIPMSKATPIHDKSIRRFIEELNEERRPDVATEQDNEEAPAFSKKRQPYHFYNNILHPLILRRLTKRSSAPSNDEFLLNDEVYFGLEPENKRNGRQISRRMLRLDGIINGGLYG